MEKTINNPNLKLAIIGMDINWGSSVGLDAFERIIYEVKENISSPVNLKITQVVDNALQDTNLEPSKIAVIIATDEDETARISQTELNKNYFITTTEKTVIKAIKTAQKLLVKQVEAVIIVVNTLQIAGALVLIDADAQKNQQRIYATIDALTLAQSPASIQTITQTCQQAFNIAGIKPEDISYLESSSILEPNQLEIKGLVAAYQTATELSCAIGSVTNIGNAAALEIASIIKTALCLYYCYIPAVPQWSSPKNPELWQGSPFYVDTQSKPWFLAAEAHQRIAAIDINHNETSAHLILSSAPEQERDSRYLTKIPYYLFPLAADEPGELLEQIEALEKIISDDSLATTAAQTFETYQKRQNATYAVAILGRNPKELQREIQRAFEGVKNAVLTGGEWKTPVGSYFTANPLGKKGKVAFVYPGAYSSYVGIARNLFRLFPKIWDSPIIQSVYSRVASIDKFLYPRSLKAFTKRQLEALEQQLIDNPLSMLESEVGIAGLIGVVLRDYFKLRPDCCFGYSVGETTMAIAQGIWTDFNPISSGLNSSQLFTTRLSGDKNAVREYWGLKDEIKGEFWRNYVLMAEISQVRAAIKNEEKVYLTQINTPKEVVIAGDTAACQRVIKAIGCNAIPAPFNHAIHCEAMASEYDEFVKLHTLPIKNKPQIDFYSASEYGLLNLDSKAMGHSIAKVLCQQFDFPRIVNRLYADGAKIFVEVGAGNACSRWIGENLQGREHTTVFLNRRGVDEHTTLLRGLAQLFSHRVQIDLSPLYNLNSSSLNSPQIEVQKIPQPVTKCDREREIITLSPYYWGNFTTQELQTSAKLNYENIEFIKLANYPETDLMNTDSKYPISSLIKKQVNSNLTNNKLTGFLQNHAKKIAETNQQSSEAHSTFLQTRKKSFGQMVKLVELQLSVFEKEHRTGKTEEK
ncbi:PfaB family protein [Rivularia sp. UHCC 0363]|uniref:PfaB family protein n=1 Tax=Rivularia sp. UHCC 0363 TaxID=3110244 RepID=UPI002B2216D0|nr:PfaB family protein [Rivularia sp. UHCC 0363]MEA5594307.1 PfaB family protein [Rivularia sp. UHCC 0363]